MSTIRAIPAWLRECFKYVKIAIAVTAGRLFLLCLNNKKLNNVIIGLWYNRGCFPGNQIFAIWRFFSPRKTALWQICRWPRAFGESALNEIFITTKTMSSISSSYEIETCKNIRDSLASYIHSITKSLFEIFNFFSVSIEGVENHINSLIKK